MIYRFDDFEVDTCTESPRDAGCDVSLRTKVWQLLHYLLMHHDRTVSKQELSEHIWPEQFVSDNTVESTVAAVRQALRDSGRTQGRIQTLHRRGYRFIASVEVEEPDTGPPGHEAQPGLAPSPATSVGPHYERKLITALCGTISPPLTQLAAGDLDRQHQLMTAWASQVQAAITPYDGTFQPLERDRFVVLFGAPRAQEDHARRALLSAMAVQQQWRDYLHTHVPSSHSPLTLGVGLHTGWVIVEAPHPASDRLTLVVDEISWVAAQLAQLADPGTPLASTAMVQQCPNRLGFEPLDALTLPG